MIDLKTLRDLVKLMAANDLTELDVQDQNERVTLKRRSGEPVHGAPFASGYVPQPTAAPVAPSPVASNSAAAPGAVNADAGLVPVASPMVGTFYAASSPEAKPFVAPGDRVVKDETVVCIIEAMKVFNEIKAEVSGTVEKVVAATGQAVEYGQPLFLVRPG